MNNITPISPSITQPSTLSRIAGTETRLPQDSGPEKIYQNIEKTLQLKQEKGVLLPTLSDPAPSAFLSGDTKAYNQVLNEARSVLGPQAQATTEAATDPTKPVDLTATPEKVVPSNMAAMIMSFLKQVIGMRAFEARVDFKRSLKSALKAYDDGLEAAHHQKESAQKEYDKEMAQAAGETVQGVFSVGAGFAPSDSIGGGINGAGTVGKSVADYTAADYGLESADKVYDEKIDETATQFDQQMGAKEDSVSAQAQANSTELLSIMQSVSQTQEDIMKAYRTA